MEEVSHEGELGDGQPELPGEEVVHNPPISPAASEGDPEETEAPSRLPESEIHLREGFSIFSSAKVWTQSVKRGGRRRRKI